MSYQTSPSVETPGAQEVQVGCWPRILPFWRRDKKRTAVQTLELPKEASSDRDPPVLVRPAVLNIYETFTLCSFVCSLLIVTGTGGTSGRRS